MDRKKINLLCLLLVYNIDLSEFKLYVEIVITQIEFRDVTRDKSNSAIKCKTT